MSSTPSDNYYNPPGSPLGSPGAPGAQFGAPNAKRLLWAGFMAILAAGIGFAVRSGILEIWGAQFGFTDGQKGLINGAGFLGFCFGIIIGGVVADKVGYKWLVIAAFLLHIVSAFVSLSPTEGMAPATAFIVLWSGSFIFAIANGTLEAVANPLVANLFPHNRTHYLNILHASWPAGMIIGGFIGIYLGPEYANASWKVQLGLFLVPTVLYGLMFLGQHMPKSEASQKGLKLGEMMKDVGILGGAVMAWLVSLFLRDSLGPILGGMMNTDFFGTITWEWISWGAGLAILVWISVITNFAAGHWLMFVLFLTHTLVGAVELGTDGWIQSITGNILTPTLGKWLFVYTSAIMFALRFCAHFIEQKLKVSPVALLMICAVLGCVGLNLVARANGIPLVMLALLVYGFGKTFFWPTMLAVASDRFPRTGAVAISIMGGIGMMSAGQLGSPGLGYAKDRFVAEELKASDAALYNEYKSPTETKFSILPSAVTLVEPVHGLDGKKLGTVKANAADAKNKAKDGEDALASLAPAERKVYEASETADRRTLKADSFIPAIMAVIYLLLLLYFKTIGGYRAITIEESKA